MIKKMGSKLKEQKGFTLIELLAVIVILGIIAAIAIPSITKVIENSKNNAKVAEAISIVDAARLSYTEGVGTTADSGATYTWTGTAGTTDPIDAYLSKVKDTTFVVTYTVATNSYKITSHNAAQVINPALTDTALDTGTDAAATVTEDQLATKASK